MEIKPSSAFIFARGGSKGIKDKNIRTVGGKPLIAHAIACGLASKYIDRVIVSTDSDKIAEAAKQYGAEILKRPAELAQDATPEIMAWRHAIASFPALFGDEDARFVSLPATSPLRAPQDVDAGIERYAEKNCDIVFGITPSHRNPYLNMVTGDEEGLIKLVIEGAGAARRQDVPQVYDITTCIYVSGPDYINRCAAMMDGRVGYVNIPPERSLDIDDEYDLHLADLMLTKPFQRKA